MLNLHSYLLAGFTAELISTILASKQQQQQSLYSLSLSLGLCKFFFDCQGSQAQYQGQWPPSLLPGQGQYRSNPPVVNNAASVSSQAMNNSLGPSPTSTPPQRSPVNPQPGEY